MIYSRIPVEIQQVAQWVCWRHEDRGGNKPTKVPYNPRTFTFADVGRPETWCTFDSCVTAISHFDGLGFVLTKNDPWRIVDLDHTTEPALIQKQEYIQKLLDSYSEISPGGNGLHIVVKAQMKADKGRRRGPFELYSSERFMTFTGNVYHNAPIQFAQGKIDHICEDLGFNHSTATANDIDRPQKHGDLDIYNIASSASNGKKFVDLWQGDITTWHFGDQSRADFALIDILAYYTQNKEQIKRLFLQSGLGRRKKAKRQDYVNNMIVRSFDNVVPEINFETFVPPQPQPLVPTNGIIQKPSHLYRQAGPLTPPPGLAGDIAEFLYSASHKPIKEVSIVGALGLMAGIAGRAFNVSSTGLNLYLLLLARTGRGKEAMAKGISKLNTRLQTVCPYIDDFEGPGDLASGQALLRAFSKSRSLSTLSIFGEFGIKLKSMCEGHFAPDLMLQKVMLDLYSKSGATDRLMPTAYSDSEKTIGILHSPAFSMIGESTPDWFYDNVDGAMISSGLLPRFAVVEYLGKRPPSNPNAASAEPSPELINKLATLLSVVQGLLQNSKRIEIPFDSVAAKLSHDLDVRADEEINNNDAGLSAELWNRAHLKTLRVAALLAVGKNSMSPIIDAECFTWAENFVTHGIETLKKRFDDGEVGTNTEQQQVNAIVKFLRRFLESKPKSQAITIAMYQKYSLPLKYIITNMRRLKIFANDKRGPSMAIKMALQALEESGDVMRMPPLQVEKLFATTGKFYTIVGDLEAY
jgi:hypothetical protein